MAESRRSAVIGTRGSVPGTSASAETVSTYGGMSARLTWANRARSSAGEGTIPRFFSGALTRSTGAPPPAASQPRAIAFTSASVTPGSAARARAYSRPIPGIGSPVR